jgi:hypothetical protein
MRSCVKRSIATGYARAGTSTPSTCTTCPEARGSAGGPEAGPKSSAGCRRRGTAYRRRRPCGARGAHSGSWQNGGGGGG